MVKAKQTGGDTNMAFILNPTPAQLTERKAQQLHDAMRFAAAAPQGALPAASCRAIAQLLREYDAARAAAR